MAIAKDSPHPATAKLFLNFALSQAGQVAFCKDVCSSVLKPTPAGTLELPEGYKSPQVSNVVANRAKTMGALGLGGN
jgi:ABC-type Fe3+ transport system substrate-binding protein